MKRRSLASRILTWLAPLAVGAVAVVAWEGAIRYWEVPQYLVPAPSAIARSLYWEAPLFADAWWMTVRTMLLALGLAVVGGVLAAIVFASSRLVEMSLSPYAVILQVTPLVAIAPLLLVWIGVPSVVMLLCAWIVSFFPILSSTTLGLRSADSGLKDLFTLYSASRWQRLRWLLVPAALPYFLSGLKIAGNLSLIGAVVAEFVTGANTSRPGLATLVYEGQYRTDMDRTFAALALISVTGILLHFATHGLSHLLLRRWHESAR